MCRGAVLGMMAWFPSRKVMSWTLKRCVLDFFLGNIFHDHAPQEGQLFRVPVLGSKLHLQFGFVKGEIGKGKIAAKDGLEEKRLGDNRTPSELAHGKGGC